LSSFTPDLHSVPDSSGQRGAGPGAAQRDRPTSTRLAAYGTVVAEVPIERVG
jgi:hypothetical protein